ncbi:MAG: hypothetical protein AAF707_03845, partial [Pseudomonadota bacterium]
EQNVTPSILLIDGVVYPRLGLGTGDSEDVGLTIMPETVLEEMDQEPVNSALSDRIAEKCGEVSVGCSDIAGLLKAVLETTEAMGAQREGMMRTFESEGPHNRMCHRCQTRDLSLFAV